jgi:hypothetical protein
MGSEGSLQYSQKPSTFPYPVSDQSNPHNLIFSLQDPVEYYPPTYVLSFQKILFLWISHE